jgi:hypothetical protein
MQINLDQWNLIITSIAACIALYTLYLTWKLSKMSFEDSLNQEYRRLAARLPVEAFFDEEISPEEFEKYRGAFYCYFDFCNEQIQLHDNKRIDEETWLEWESGIRFNFNRRMFEYAWNHCGEPCRDLKALKKYRDKMRLTS